MGNSMSNNKLQKSKYSPIIQCILLIMGLIHLPFAMAVCGTDEDDDYYGNAETCPFKNATESTEGLTPEDIAFLNAVNATRIINRWYMRLFVGKPKVRLNSIQNTSVGLYNGLSPGTSAINQNIFQATLAGGYFWEQWAVEFEIYFSKKFDFTLNPVYGGIVPVAPPGLTATQVTAQLNEVAGFLNLQYVVPRLFSWYPRRLQIHFDAGVGPALTQTNITALTATGVTLQSGSTRTLAAAANLGVGARYQVSAHWLVDVAYRYFYIGKTKFGPALGGDPTQDVQFTTKQLQANGWFIGAMYQF